MSDNLTAQEIRRRLVIFLRIPTEVWTDVLKLFPRRTLIQQIAPTCYRFKEISNTNVKNVHVIENPSQFTVKLNKNDPEANQQLEQLAGSNCHLSDQFRLTNLWISEKSKAILCHCPDLFKGCQITLDIKEKNKDSKLFLESLGHLEGAKPAEIRVIQHVDQFVDYWHHPTFLNCDRVDLSLSSLSAATMMNIFDWLHHQPNGVDCCSGSADDQQVHCMTVWGWGRTGHDHVDWLIDRCSEDIQQGQRPIDRRSFVLGFCCLDWPGFGQFRRIENKSTGEVLTLERKMHANGGQATNCYRLRRCLTEEEANGAEFYASMFEQDCWVDVFNIEDETTKVMIK